MNLSKLVSPIITLCFLMGILLWQTSDPTRDFKINDEGFDPRTTETDVEITIGDKFTTYGAKPSDLSGEWLMFRGADRNNIIENSVDLAATWPKSGPKQLWKIKLGEGHSAPVVYKGCFYVLDYNEIKRQEQLRCFNLQTGQEVWRRSYKLKMKKNHGFSRTVPAIADGKIVTFGPLSHVMCLDAVTGELLWAKDLVNEYGSKTPFWYSGQCPYIDGNSVILAPAGKEKLLISLDIETGKELWSTPNTPQTSLSHSSVMPMTLEGIKTYVYCGIGGIVGVEATTGKLLWVSKAFKASVIAPSPLVFDDGRIYMTAGYGAGSVTFKVTADNGAFDIQIVNQSKANKGIASEQQTPIHYKNKVFIIMPKDGGNIRNQLVCADADDLTQVMYTSGKEKRFGIGPFIIADGKLYILDDDGTLIVTDAESETYTELFRHRILDGHDAWGPLVIVDGLMIMRDSKTMVCLDIRKKSKEVR